MERKKIKKKYREIIEENETRLGKLKKRQFLVSMMRLVLFAGGIAASVPFFRSSVTAGIIVLIISAFLFILLVKYYTILAEKIHFTSNIIRINESELKGFQGDYSAFNGGNEWIDKDHDFSMDTDLFGNDSLFRFLNRTVTGFGRETLARWLSKPYLFRNYIETRQEAVKELAPEISWRQEFMAHGLGEPLEKEDVESLKSWLEEKESFLSSSTLKTLILLSPVLTVSLLVLALLNLIPFNILGFLFILNLLFVGAYLKKTNRIHTMVSRKFSLLSSFEKLISLFGNEQFRSQILKGAAGRLISDNKSAALTIRELRRIIEAFDSRLNIFAGFLLNGLILWDFQCLIRLESWKAESAGQLPEWLETIGEVDALVSLANHAYNNPEYVFPEITSGEPVIDAVNMGHPLIEEKARIHNDFLMSSKGLICIITGANMSGKSTFLRTVAVNLVMGMAGTVVCASRFRFIPCNLFSSMITTDSLSKNESYFYAELKRLKTLKEKLESGEEFFFLLDEILKGTNSEDKSTGSKLFLSRLTDLNGTGIIATHDLSLGKMEHKFPGKIFNKCFEVEIEGENIIFDYKLRDGITRHMNAGLLMRQMGILE